MKRSMLILALIFVLVSATACHKPNRDTSTTAEAAAPAPGPSPTPTLQPGWEPNALVGSDGKILRFVGFHVIMGDIPVKGKWYKHKPDLKAAMDDRPNDVVLLDSDTPLTLVHSLDGKPNREFTSSTAFLAVRCAMWDGNRKRPFDPKRVFSVSIALGAPAASAPHSPVRLRYDEEPASAETWNVGVVPYLLKPPDEDEFVRRIAKTDSLLFEFTPKGEASQIVKFDIRDFRDLLPDMDAMCRPR
jgi:hypothetical protein